MATATFPAPSPAPPWEASASSFALICSAVALAGICTVVDPTERATVPVVARIARSATSSVPPTTSRADRASSAAANCVAGTTDNEGSSTAALLPRISKWAPAAADTAVTTTFPAPMLGNRSSAAWIAFAPAAGTTTESVPSLRTTKPEVPLGARPVKARLSSPVIVAATSWLDIANWSVGAESRPGNEMPYSGGATETFPMPISGRPSSAVSISIASAVAETKTQPWPSVTT